MSSRAASERDPRRDAANAVAWSRRWQRHGPLLLALAPATALVGVFYLWPALWAISTSLTDLDLTAFAAGTHFVGLANFRQLLRDPDIPLVVRNTVVFTVGSAVIGQFVLGWALALLLNHARARGYRLWQLAYAAMLTAWVSPLVLAGFIWVGMLDYFDGTINAALSGAGAAPIDWLGRFPMLSVIVADAWRGTAFTVLVLLGALQTIPREIHEAAALDGAGAWRRFWDHTRPLVRQFAALALLVATINALGSFILINVLTSGAGLQTTTLALYGYRQALIEYEIGYGSAVAVVTLLVNLVFAAVYLSVARRRE